MALLRIIRCAPTYVRMALMAPSSFRPIWRSSTSSRPFGDVEMPAASVFHERNRKRPVFVADHQDLVSPLILEAPPLGDGDLEDLPCALARSRTPASRSAWESGPKTAVSCSGPLALTASMSPLTAASGVGNAFAGGRDGAEVHDSIAASDTDNVKIRNVIAASHRRRRRRRGCRTTLLSARAGGAF